MEVKDSKPTKGELRQAFGTIGDQDIISSQKPEKEALLKELAVLKGVDPKTNSEVLGDVLKNVLENERLLEEEKK